MRIATPQLYNNLLSGVRKQQEIQNDGNTKITSGTRFQTPSQAGLEYKTSLDIRHAQTSIRGSLDALTIAESRLDISQTLLHSMTNYLNRAQILAIQTASAQAGAAERQVALLEITHLTNQLLADSNQTWQGQSLFSGAAVDKAAFVDDGSGNISYNGSNQNRIIAVNDNQQVISNLRGDDPAFAAAFTAMQTFKTALQNNDAAAIQNALGQLNSAGDGMVDLTSQAGTRLNAVRISRTSFEDMKFNLDKQLNNHESVDIPAIVAQLQQSSIALQAAYSQIAQLKTLSLINFLR